MNASLKAQILDRMTKVDQNSITGYSMHLFAREAHLKSDAQVIEAVTSIQSQIHDCECVMRRILMNQFDFFKNLSIQ